MATERGPRSPNHGPRRGGQRPRLVVLHHTAMLSAEAALERLCDPAFEVSAHWLIGRDGRVWHLVDESRRAWHAGAGSWGGLGDVNSRSIGIEERLLSGVLARWELPAKAVIGHSDMAPGRKVDPGPRFDWLRLAKAGLAVWPAAGLADAAPDPARFMADAAAFGWPVEAGPDLVLAALRLRFRPTAEGPLSAADMAVAAELARRFPVDGLAVSA